MPPSSRRSRTPRLRGSGRGIETVSVKLRTARGRRAAWRSGVGRGIEEGQLGRVGRLEQRRPLIEVSATDRRSLPGRLRVASLDPPPQLAARHIEMVKFDADAELASRLSELV